MLYITFLVFIYFKSESLYLLTTSSNPPSSCFLSRERQYIAIKINFNCFNINHTWYSPKEKSKFVPTYKQGLQNFLANPLLETTTGYKSEHCPDFTYYHLFQTFTSLSSARSSNKCEPMRHKVQRNSQLKKENLMFQIQIIGFLRYSSSQLRYLRMYMYIKECKRVLQHNHRLKQGCNSVFSHQIFRLNVYIHLVDVKSHIPLPAVHPHIYIPTVFSTHYYKLYSISKQGHC